MRKGDYFKYGEDIGESISLAVGGIEDYIGYDEFELWYQDAMLEWQEWGYSFEEADNEIEEDLDLFN